MFSLKNLCHLAYANGHNQWLYQDRNLTMAEIETPGFWRAMPGGLNDPVSSWSRVVLGFDGDLVTIVCRGGTALRSLERASDGSWIIRGLL